MTADELVVSVLAEHARTPYWDGEDPIPVEGCKCGWRGGRALNDSVQQVELHRAHVAAKVIDALGIEQVGWTDDYAELHDDNPSSEGVPVYRLKALEEGGGET